MCYQQIVNKPKMTNSLGSNQWQDDVIVLLALESINRGYFIRPANKRVVSTPLPDDITNEVFWPL